MPLISASLDVTKIDKSRIHVGEKGKYLDITLIETPNSQYGDDYMVVQSVTKEEREQGVKGNILGNGKIFGNDRREPQPTADVDEWTAPPKSDDDVPF